MKKLVILAVCLMFNICCFVYASSDDLENIGTNGTIISSRIIDGVTVSITTQGDYPMLARTYYDSIDFSFNGANTLPNTPLYPGNVSGSRFISTYVDTIDFGFDDVQPIIFQFDQPITFFGLTTLDLCENDDLNAVLMLQAYDVNNIMISEHIRSGPQGPSGIDLDWGVFGNGIVKVLLTGTISSYYHGYGIDDLTLEKGFIDDFEDLEPICTTEVTSRNIDGVMVTISSQTEDPIYSRIYYDSTSICFSFNGANSVPNTPLNPENVSGSRFISTFVDTVGFGFTDVQPIIFQFDQPITFFGLTTLDLCEEGDPDPMLKLQAFNSSDNLIGEHIRTGNQGSSGIDLDWGISGEGIVKVLLAGNINGEYHGYGIDDLVLLKPISIGINKSLQYDKNSFLQIFPNPTQTKFNFLLSKDDKQVEIFNLQGQLYYFEEIIFPTTQYRKEINISHLPNSIYMVKVSGVRGIKVGKVLKK